jgi:hypothetical protein
MDNPSLMGWFKKQHKRAREVIKKFMDNTEDKVVDHYLSNTPPYKHMPKGHRDKVRRIRRIGIDYKKEVDDAKRTGKNIVRMWVWYSLIRLPANLDPESGFMLKLSAQGLRILAMVDIALVLEEWSKQKAKK